MQELFSTVFNSIFPVFFIIALGFYLYKISFISKELQQGLNKLAYWIALPAFLFYKVALAKLEAEMTGRLLSCMAAATICCMLLSFLFAKAFKASGESTGAGIQAAARGNLAFVALPIIMAVVNKAAPERADVIIDNVILTLTPIVILYNLICVTLLVIYSSKKKKNLRQDIIRELYTNPLIITCVLGLLYNFRGPEVSGDNAFFRVCSTVGAAAFPMALIGVGSQLAQLSIKGHIKWVVIFASIKTIIAPLAGLAISRLLHMDHLETMAVMIMMASPTAVAAYVLADQLSCDADLTASTILLSTILSFLSFSSILLYFSGVV